MLELNIRIVGPEGDLSDREKAILAAVAGTPGAVINITGDPAPEEKPPAEEPAPAPTRTRTSKAAKEAAEKEAKEKADAAAAAELLGGDSAPAEDEMDDEAKLAKCVERATAFIANSDTAKLRAILGEIGVQRVSELEGDGLDKFLAATA